jgi:hypothetical protein
MREQRSGRIGPWYGGAAELPRHWRASARIRATAEDSCKHRATRRELWPGLLIILLITLFLEQTLAWWFGQPHRPCQPRAR